MNKSYYYSLLFSVFILFGCYSDDSQVVDSMNSLHRTSELTDLIKSITLHNASFDDHIDNTSCFSLVFPYELKVDSESRVVNSAQDIRSLRGSSTKVEIVFPVSVVFSTYSIHEVSSVSELDELRTTCEAETKVDINTCYDLNYPVVVREFNEFNTNFETLQLNNDQDFFQYLDNLHDSDLFEIEYPVTLFRSDTSISIDSTDALIETLRSSSDCD